MFLEPLDLTTALRPTLLSDEALLFVQDDVGLYEGFVFSCLQILERTWAHEMANYRAFKIPNLQNGHAYLTSHRVCYVDNLEPRKNSVAVELRSIEKYEFYVGFSSHEMDDTLS